MKKIGIITLNGYFNYGNRLQNYALQETLKSLGFSVETLLVNDVDANEGLKKVIGKKLKTIQQESFATNLNTLYKKINNKLNRNVVNKRTDIFKKFTKKYIAETTFKVSAEELKKIYESQYDYFVVGSDQVWNPKYINNPSLYFLAFAEEHKRISYAASFGISEIPQDFKQEYIQYLNDMRYVSVREEEAANIIKSLTGREVSVLVDPTLLLTREEWLQISTKAHNKPKDKYLLTYFVDGISAKHKKHIHLLAKQNNLSIVNLADIHEKDTYTTGPSGFIDYIKDSQILCTDSFHGTVFSIILEKPFIVYQRSGAHSIYSRLNTILDKFNFNERKVENIQKMNEIFNINFEHVAPILQKEREKSLNYLKQALQVEQEV